jgi:hypothetical protein
VYIDEQIDVLTQVIVGQKEELAVVCRDVIILKDYMRRDNIVVFGIPETTDRLLKSLKSILRDPKAIGMS